MKKKVARKVSNLLRYFLFSLWLDFFSVFNWKEVITSINVKLDSSCSSDMKKSNSFLSFWLYCSFHANLRSSLAKYKKNSSPSFFGQKLKSHLEHFYNSSNVLFASWCGLVKWFTDKVKLANQRLGSDWVMPLSYVKNLIKI